MNSNVGTILFIVILVVTALAALAVLTGTILLFIPSARRIGGLMALIGGLALIVAAGLCFAVLPQVAG